MSSGLAFRVCREVKECGVGESADRAHPQLHGPRPVILAKPHRAKPLRKTGPFTTLLANHPTTLPLPPMITRTTHKRPWFHGGFLEQQPLPLGWPRAPPLPPPIFSPYGNISSVSKQYNTVTQCLGLGALWTGNQSVLRGGGARSWRVGGPRSSHTTWPPAGQFSEAAPLHFPAYQSSHRSCKACQERPIQDMPLRIFNLNVQ